MTLGEYRALVAYLNYWPPLIPEMNLDTAIVDLGLTDDRDAIIHELFKAGHTWNDDTRTLVYDDN